MEYDIETDYLGTKRYYKKGTNLFHRENGPAVEWRDGYKEWWVNGELHRTDGPAIEYESGDQSWYFNGLPHRMDGPALDWKDKKVWYINGERLSPEKEVVLNKWWDNKNGM